MGIVVGHNTGWQIDANPRFISRTAEGPGKEHAPHSISIQTVSICRRQWPASEEPTEKAGHSLVKVRSLTDNWRVVNSTLVVGVTGIVVSGVIGPGLTARFSRRAQVREFNRAQAAGRRDALRVLLDQAAVLLASGATNLRLLQDQRDKSNQAQGARDWMMQIFPLGQRLQLWLRHDDPVVVAYERVREQLIKAAQAGNSQAAETELQQFESDRRDFLDVARSRLLQPVPATDGAE